MADLSPARRDNDQPSKGVNRQMAGRPMFRKLCADIKAQGGDQMIFDRIVSGEPIGKIAESFGVSRTFLYEWRNRGLEPDAQKARKRAWFLAIRHRAQYHEEQAAEVLGDEPPHTAAEARWRKDKSETHKWQAGIHDPETYGEKKADLNIQMNVGQLHLDALRQRGAVEVIQEAEIEILPAHPAQDEFAILTEGENDAD